MTKLPKLTRLLVLAAVLGLAACASNERAPELSPAARRSLAEAVDGGDIDTAGVGALRDAARRAPNNAAAQQRYGLAAERAKLYPEALMALDRAVAVGGAVPALLLTQGRIALEAGDVPAAALAYSRTLDGDPRNVGALSGLGVAEDLERRHEEARERYNEALRLAPGDWKVRSNLAMSLLMSDRAVEAAAVLAGADRDPAAPRRARDDLALALVAAGRRNQAISVLRADMSEPEAATLADEFAGFSRWLASPEGNTPAVR